MSARHLFIMANFSSTDMPAEKRNNKGVAALKHYHILLIDNYPLSRLGTLNAIQKELPGSKIKETAVPKEAFLLLKEKKYDLVILALSTPGKTAIDIVKRLLTLHKKTPLLVNCIYPENVYAERILKLGAKGYLSRENPVSDLVVALRKILGGGIYVSDSQAENFVAAIQKKPRLQTLESLSDRELQMLQLIASGKTIKEIATEINLSVTTISTYRQRVLLKLGFKTNAQLTRFAFENALV